MARRTSAEWRGLIAEWQQSGLDARSFGARTGLDPKRLSWWKWRLKTKPTGSPNPTLVPVHLVTRAPQSVEQTTRTIAVRLPSGVQLQLDSQISEDALVRVLRAVERACF